MAKIFVTKLAKFNFFAGDDIGNFFNYVLNQMIGVINSVW